VLPVTAPARALAEVMLRVPLLDPGDAEDLTVRCRRVADRCAARAACARQRASEVHGRAALERGAETFVGELRAAGEAWYQPVALAAPTSGESVVSLEVVLEQDGQQTRIKRTRTLVPRVASTLARLIHIDGALMPTDVTGARDPRLRPDTIPLPGRVTSALRRWLGLPLEKNDPYDPFVWQSVRLASEPGAPALALEAHASVVDAAGAPVPALAPPDLHRTGVTSSRVWTPARPRRDAHGHAADLRRSRPRRARTLPARGATARARRARLLPRAAVPARGARAA
jgi:hypothetical protein